MGKSFYQAGMKDKIAIFNLFFRDAPDKNNWAVVSGIRESLEMIGGIGSEKAAFFEKFIPGDEYAEFREYLSKMRFTGNVYAMREGEIAFPKQPIITIEAPIIEAQVLETPLLCIMNHQMAIATKASRVTRSTEKPVSEFGSRRAHGPWAATYGAKAAIIGGCANSSNILTSAIFDVPSSGTMAHSYVTSFGCSIEGEFNAFKTYIETHRGEPLILLIDTYDSLNCGLKNALRAYRECGIDNSYPDMLDKAGFTDCKIFATNSLDEYLITELERQGAMIDSYGVGDAIATSKHNPCFGNVYKLVQIGGEPVLKRSEDKSKLINPGFQITYRIIQNGMFKADVTCLRGDEMSGRIENCEEIHIRSEFDETRNKTFPKGIYSWKRLQEQVMKNGDNILQDIKLPEKQKYYLSNLMSFNETERRLINPHFYKVDISDDLYNLKMKLINNLIKEIKNFDI